MAQDIRELFKNDRGIPKEGLRKGHEARFEARLDETFGDAPKKSGNNYLWMKIAAVLVVIVGVGGLLLTNPLQTGSSGDTPQTEDAVAGQETTKMQLSDVSPEFKKVEDYYLASINVELAQLKITDDNKALIDSFMLQLEELNDEYKRLNEDLAETGVNEQTVNALISNLQLRLDLLFRLKEKLNELKETNEPGVASGADKTKTYTI